MMLRQNRNLFTDRSCVTLKIWFNTGVAIEESYSLDSTTFGDVKLSAIRYWLEMIQSPSYPRSNFSTLNSNRLSVADDEIPNYKLISVGSKRSVQDKSGLRESRVTDGGKRITK